MEQSQIKKENNAFIKTYQSPRKIQKGDEVGIFHMGSTVVMLYPPKMNPHLAGLTEGAVKVRDWYNS